MMRAAAAIFVAAGAALRLVQFADRRPLWLDEAMLGLNVATRSFGQLLRPLDYNQTAPLLFLWIERLLALLLGVNELALRAFPTAAGIALVPLAGIAARRLSGPAAGLAAVTLAALSPSLIRYSNELKPYETDALATVALVLAATATIDRVGSAQRWRVLGLTGVVAILLSTPAIFTAAAVVLSLLVPRTTRGRHLLVCAASWAALSALLYAGIYAPAAHNPFQQQAYEGGFLVPGPELRERLPLTLRGTLLPPFFGNGSTIPILPGWPLVVLGAVLLAGLAHSARRHGFWAPLLLAGPLLAATTASALRRYPIGVPRLMVFSAPLLILMAACCVGWAVDASRPRVRPALLVVMGLLAVAPGAAARLQDALHPFRGEDAAALVAAFRDQHGPFEPVYISAKGIPSWVFYTTDWSNPNRDRLAFYGRAASSGPSFENAPSRQRRAEGEGRDLVYELRLRREILGVFTGRQWRWPDYSKPTPDEGWAANEAARIVDETRRTVVEHSGMAPCAWLYFTRLSERANRPLSWELRDAYGGTREYELGVPGGVLWKYCFPPTSRWP